MFSRAESGVLNKVSTVNKGPDFVEFLDIPHSVVGAVIVSNGKCSVTTDTFHLLVSPTSNAIGKHLSVMYVHGRHNVYRAGDSFVEPMCTVIHFLDEIRTNLFVM